jgi:hypothetical protein
MSNAELASAYAALILADDGIDITVRQPIYLETPSRRGDGAMEREKDTTPR